MGSYTLISALFLITIQIYSTSCQYPQRLQIPGALLVQSIPQQQRQRQRIQTLPQEPLPRPRKPISNSFPAPIPIREIRPVNEEPQELDIQRPSILDEEVAKLSLSSLQAGVGQGLEEENRPLPFRPERPIPVLREQIRENIPRPPPISRPLPVVRQEFSQPRPAPVPRPVVRQEAISRPLPQRAPVRNYDDDEEENIPVRRPAAPVRQRVQSAPRPVGQQGEQRDKKPPVQILRKYRTDNADGSITWGYENEDGTFKEETIGIDCITRGKYGYVDPDGVKREFNYETGLLCDPEEEELEELPPQAIKGGPRKPQQQQPQQQYSARSF